jgi:hypothetical protein
LITTDLTTGDKVGIGIGGGTALGLVGFWFVIFQFQTSSGVAFLKKNLTANC